jgi:anti-sigma factor ChrR (cupin superfamily)
MSSAPPQSPCEHSERVALHALGSLPAHEARQLETHLADCQECRDELESLRPLVESFSDWPTDVLRPSAALWDRLARRIGAEGREPQLSCAPAEAERLEPQWREAGPGITYKLLATDPDGYVSLLVRLAPGAAYPSHTHAGREELHLLAGELWIEDRKLYPGEYNRGDCGGSDQRVWTETGCTCVLITSLRDTLL